MRCSAEGEADLRSTGDPSSAHPPDRMSRRTFALPLSYTVGAFAKAGDTAAEGRVRSTANAESEEDRPKQRRLACTAFSDRRCSVGAACTDSPFRQRASLLLVMCVSGTCCKDRLLFVPRVASDREGRQATNQSSVDVHASPRSSVTVFHDGPSPPMPLAARRSVRERVGAAQFEGPLRSATVSDSCEAPI